jgi:hypothetical protein
MSSLFIKKLYAKCKMHGTGDAQVILTDDELYALILIALNDLGWLSEYTDTKSLYLPSDNYYALPLAWFETLNIKATGIDIMAVLEFAKNKNDDFVLYIRHSAPRST